MGFVVIAFVLLGAALLLPVALAAVLRVAESLARRPLARWFFADGRQEISGLSLAMMALLLALATNIGVGGMVEGFRRTFAGWLDERLAAEIYYEAATPTDARDIEVMGAEAARRHGGSPDLAGPDAAWRLAGRPDRHGAARDLFAAFHPARRRSRRFPGAA